VDLLADLSKSALNLPPLQQTAQFLPQPNFFPGLQPQLNPMYMYPFMFNPMVVPGSLPQPSPPQANQNLTPAQSLQPQMSASHPNLGAYPPIHPLGRESFTSAYVMTPQGFLIPSYMLGQGSIPQPQLLPSQPLQGYPGNLGLVQPQNFSGFPQLGGSGHPVTGSQLGQMANGPSNFGGYDPQAAIQLPNLSKPGDLAVPVVPRAQSDHNSSRVSPLVSNPGTHEPHHTIQKPPFKPEEKPISRSDLEWEGSGDHERRDNKHEHERGRFDKDYKEPNKNKPFKKDYSRNIDKKFKRENVDKFQNKNFKQGPVPIKKETATKSSFQGESQPETKTSESDHDKILKLLKEVKGIESTADAAGKPTVREEATLQPKKWVKTDNKERKKSRSRSRSKEKAKPKEEVTSSSKKRFELLNKRFDMLFHKKKDESEEEDLDENKLDMSPRSPEESDHEYYS
jgi:hypothetical protein